MTLHEDGVYFGMPDEEYHRDPALGSTDLKRLLISPAEYYWHSHLNPLYHSDDSKTPARTRGTAFHHLVLWGEESFAGHYIRGLDKDEHPDALVTAADLKAACKRYNLATTGTKEELSARLAGMVPTIKIFDRMAEALEATGKIVLPAWTYDEVIVSSKMITRNPSLQSSFSGGQPEVSIFWTDNGVRLKGRLDYLKTRAIGDLKSFTNVLDKPLDRAIISAFQNYNMHIQASHYLTARKMLRGLVEEGRVSGEVDRDWLDKVARSEFFDFVFTFFQTGGAPVARGLQYVRGGSLDGFALAKIAEAVDVYRTALDRFGLDAMWIDTAPIHVLTEDDLSLWFGR